MTNLSEQIHYYQVSAKKDGNTLEYKVKAKDLKEAFYLAREEAKRLFDYQGFGEMPTVHIKPLSKIS